MCTKWIKNHDEVPKIEVDTVKNINKQMKNKSDNQLFKSMNQALDEMRLNDEAIQFTLKNMDSIINPLLKKRLEKKNSLKENDSAELT
jgi:hypothetical protein